ncbi:bis(5'-nucleosyl)-tetraphosphatase PrpE [Peribacillus sp. SCS-37]|uniref:bis(5'-nucleosyl)-tetraphosphatase PrpE n=1 Tax=Paraperibacillus esterisolvens TaxID=3115296 RepID=UPI003905C6A3
MKLDIIGDIHGCYDEFHRLTVSLGYSWKEGIPVHPDGRRLAFVGDLTDRGPHSLKVAELVWKLVIEKKTAFYVPGNHCDKLYRFFKGNPVKLAHGLETTAAEYESLSPGEKEKIKTRFMELYEESPIYQILDEGKLVIAHAGIKEEFIGRYSPRIKTFVLYGDITGETNPDGTPVRRNWAREYKGKAIVVYGHTPVRDVQKTGHTYNIDTGAVFGGALSSLRYPELSVVSTASGMPYLPEKFRGWE